jgi:hypothetical protein
MLQGIPAGTESQREYVLLILPSCWRRRPQKSRPERSLACLKKLLTKCLRPQPKLASASTVPNTSLSSLWKQCNDIPGIMATGFLFSRNGKLLLKFVTKMASFHVPSPFEIVIERRNCGSSLSREDEEKLRNGRGKAWRSHAEQIAGRATVGSVSFFRLEGCRKAIAHLKDSMVLALSKPT